MNKISSTKAAALLKQAGVAIRTVTQERNAALQKVARYERATTVTKIARDMEDKGLEADKTFEEKVAAVSRSQDLRVTAEAVKMAAPQGHILGDLDDVPGVGGNLSVFEHFIMTGEDPTG